MILFLTVLKIISPIFLLGSIGFIWEKAKVKCIPRKWSYKYPLPTFKGTKRDLANII